MYQIECERQEMGHLGHCSRMSVMVYKCTSKARLSHNGQKNCYNLKVFLLYQCLFSKLKGLNCW